MPQSTAQEQVSNGSGLLDVAFVARIRRLIIVAALASAGYGLFNAAYKSYCPGGITPAGTFLDALGNATDVAPTCISLALRPSGLVYAAIIAIVIGALTLVLRRATDEASAIRYVERAATATVIVAVASIVISQVWFSLIPLTDWNGTGTFFYPFPFGSVDLEITPLPRS